MSRRFIMVYKSSVRDALNNYVMNVAQGEKERTRKLVAARKLVGIAKTPRQRKEAALILKRVEHVVKWCAAALVVANDPRKGPARRNIRAAWNERDEVPCEADEGYCAEAAEAAEKHVKEVEARAIGKPGPWLPDDDHEMSGWAIRNMYDAQQERRRRRLRRAHRSQ